MSWTVFHVMRMREYKFCRSNCFSFYRKDVLSYFAVLQQFFVLNFVKKFTKVQHGFLDFNWK